MHSSQDRTSSRVSVRLLIRLGIGLMLVAILALVIFFEPLRLLAIGVTAPVGLTSNTLAVKFQVDKKLVAGGFTLPVQVTHAGEDASRLFVVEKVGRIRIIKDGKTLTTPFLDITKRVGASGNEQGLLSVAFHPKFKDNGYFYVNYTDLQGDTNIVRFSVNATTPDLADASSAKVLLKIDQPFPNHNGGLVMFGPDGYLYVGMGDGGAAGDPLGAGQDKFNLLGKILRLDIDQGDPYGIPKDNPFADGKAGAPEVWTLGWRNPWRFSFDRATGDLYVGDVGQNKYEEISLHRAGEPGGLNYGWNTMEASHCFAPPSGCSTEGFAFPITEYNHSLGNSVTGGYVYRGKQFPDLVGYYFYADFGSSRLWALRETAPNTWENAEIGQLSLLVSSFGEDAAGELYVVDYGDGGVYQLIQK